MEDLLRKLKGGDRRSIGEADEVAACVGRNPGLFGQLVDGMLDDDPVIAMRSADAAEKATRVRPELLRRWKSRLLRIAGTAAQKELRWHLAQMIGRMTLAPAEQRGATEILNFWLEDESSIVKTCAMEALTAIACGCPAMRDEIAPTIERLARTGTPAMRARGRRLVKQLARISCLHEPDHS